MIEQDQRVPIRTVVLALAAFAACSIAAAIRSQGFLESDGGTHYLFARHALEQPIYFVDVWGRPLCTALFCIPAKFAGLIGVRLTSLAVAIACALVAMRIATIQKYKWPVLALIFTLGQPLFFLHSFSELTELPFALVIGLAFIAYQQQRWGVMSALIAISPAGRPEGFAFLFLAAIALIGRRQWKWLLMLPMGLIAWSLLGHWLTGPADAPWWRWLVDHWPYESGSAYPRGYLLFFVAALPVLVGPFALPALWIGIARNISAAIPWRRLVNDPKARVDFIIAVLPLAILTGHAVLSWLGKMSSSGALRYLLIVAPLWGVLVARGWEWCFTRMKWRGAIQWAALAAVAPGCVNFAYRVLPVEQTIDWREAYQVIDWYSKDPLRQEYPRIMSNHPGIFFYLDASPWDRARVEPWTREAIDHPPGGVILVWDPEFSVKNSNPNLVISLRRVLDAGWVNDSQAELASNPPISGKSLPDDAKSWHLFLSPAARDGTKTPSVAREAHGVRWKHINDEKMLVP